MNIGNFEQQLTEALKRRNATEVSTLRLLIARLKNEQIASGATLDDGSILKIVQSEYKKRKEAADEYSRGGRAELASKELAEAEILATFLPKQLAEAEIVNIIDEVLVANAWTMADFGVAMKTLKERLGATVDGAVLSKLLKEKLK